MTTNKKPTAQFEVVTPDVAAKLLEANVSNRPIDLNRIKRYVREMELGRWQVNGDTCRIATNGMLLDGQHRLTAIVESNIPIEMLVVRGLNPSVFSTIDVGKNRTARDVLAIQGHRNSAQLAAAARIMFNLEQETGYFATVKSLRWKSISNDDVLDVISNNPDLPATVDEFYKSFPKARRLFGKGAAAGLYFLFKKKSPTLAQEYFHGLETGLGLDGNSVIYQVREKLLGIMGSNQRVEHGFKVAIAVKGWNLMRDGYYDKRLVMNDKTIIDQIK